MTGILCIGSSVEFVNVAVLFDIHYSRMVGSLGGGAPFVVCVDRCNISSVSSVAIYRVCGALQYIE